MASKLDLKTYRGKLTSFNPNLNKGTFPTQHQVDQIFHNRKNALSQVFRIEIENPETFTQTTFVMKHAKARGISTDYDAKELHYGAMVQIQGYYNPDNDLHTAIGIQVWTKQNTKSSASTSEDVNQSEVALSQVAKASMANSESNATIKSLVQQRASESIAQKFHSDSKINNSKDNSISAQASKSTSQPKNDNQSLATKNQQMLNKINTMKRNINHDINKPKSHSHLKKSKSLSNQSKTSVSSLQSQSASASNNKSRSNKNIKHLTKSSTTNDSHSSSNNSIQDSNSNPKDVIDSAMAQVKRAGYHVQLFGYNKNDNVKSQSQANHSIKRNNKVQSYKKTNKNTMSAKPKATDYKASDIDDRNNKKIKKEFSTRSTSPSNFLPSDSGKTLLKTNKFHSAKQKNQKSDKSQESKIQRNNSQANKNNKKAKINSIATKYHVPTSMATIKYKIMSQSSASASQLASSRASVSESNQIKQSKINKHNQYNKSKATNSSQKSHSHKLTKIHKLREQQKYYKQIDNQDTNTLKQLEQLQKKDSKQQAKDKDIPTTREITQKVQKNQLPTEHLSKHGKEIQKAYQQVMNSKHMTTEQLDDKLRDIYRLEGWDDFFEQDTKTFLRQLKGDLNRILEGEDVKYPLSYNRIPDISKFKKLVELQRLQDLQNKKDK